MLLSFLQRILFKKILIFNTNILFKIRTFTFKIRTLIYRTEIIKSITKVYFQHLDPRLQNQQLHLQYLLNSYPQGYVWVNSSPACLHFWGNRIDKIIITSTPQLSVLSLVNALAFLTVSPILFLLPFLFFFISTGLVFFSCSALTLARIDSHLWYIYGLWWKELWLYSKYINTNTWHPIANITLFIVPNSFSGSCFFDILL